MPLQRKTLHINRLVFLLVAFVLLGLWAVVLMFTSAERSLTLERAREQLQATAITLADFNELAALRELSVEGSDARTDALWRALLQYPSVSIWVESDGVVTGGLPSADLSASIVAEEARNSFVVFAALPEAEALREWSEDRLLRVLALSIVTFIMLVLTQFLVQALRLRTEAERAAAASEEAKRQLQLYGETLERTVAERTAQLAGVNAQLGEELKERKLAEEKIAAMARTDALTGLANRVTFNERLQQALAATRRGAKPFAVFYMDLDRFKTVNDTLGHAIGDELLKETGRRLRQTTRETDLVARLGGDEFAVLQMNISEVSNAATLAQNIQNALGRPMMLEGNELRVSSSIGICPWSPDIKDADSMLVQADLALYRAKEDGRNCYRFHSVELDKEVMQRNALADELRLGIDRGELELRWQPQVAIADKHIVGVEALVRWRHPTRGLIDAHDFIPVAEKTGSIMAVGHWVLDGACRQLREWRDAGLQLGEITLNLSQTQLKNSADLITDVVTTTAKWGLVPADLEFDVTEGMLAQTTWTQNDVLARLRALGCKIAIDSFGTAYSSFEYLRAYEVNHLKVARIFIREAVHDPAQARTIKAIIQLARELGVGVVVEGVETAEQNALLQSLNQSANAQGYFYSRAVDGLEASAMLKSGHARPQDASLAHSSNPNDLL